MIIDYLKKSKNAIKLVSDGLLKIITGLIIIKIITNIDDALLANFSQLKMMTALLISVSSGVFIIGLNKLSIKYKDSLYVGSMFLFVFLISLFAVGCVFVFDDDIQKLIGRTTELFYGLLLVFISCGFVANYLVGCRVAANENESIANGKLYSTVYSFLTFLVLYFCGVNIWLSLFLYLISYYLFMSVFLFKKAYFQFFKWRINLTRDLWIDLYSIYFLAIVSAIVFPSCILFFRYHLSVNASWQAVSLWEAEWQLSSLMLLVLSPVLSIILTTFFTDKLNKLQINRALLVKVIFIFMVFSLAFSVGIYLAKSLLITLLFNTEMLNATYSSSLLTLLLVNFFRMLSVVIFYILYVIIDTKKLVYSELLFGFVFMLGLFLGVGEQNNLDMYIFLPVVVSFTYLLILLLNTDEFKNN